MNNRGEFSWTSVILAMIVGALLLYLTFVIADNFLNVGNDVFGMT